MNGGMEKNEVKWNEGRDTIYRTTKQCEPTGCRLVSFIVYVTRDTGSKVNTVYLTK